MMRPLDDWTSAQGGVISAAQTERAGLTRAQRRTLLKSGELREIRHGIFTTQDIWDAADAQGKHRIHVAGALLIRGWDHSAPAHRFVGGLRSAAFLLGVPFQPEATDVDALSLERDRRRLSPEARAVQAEVSQIRRGHGPRHIDIVSTDRCRRTYAHGVQVRPAALPVGDVVLSGGVPITSLARTAVDLMREGSPADALIAADGVLHIGLSRAELEAVAARCAGWCGIGQALQAIAFADGLAESAAESLARFVCAQCPEVPTPELQVDLFDALGRIGRVDLLFRAFAVVLEVDGYVKYTDPWCGDAAEAFRRQNEREARLRHAGWTVIRTTWLELTTDPAGFIRRLLAAFATAA